jgi:hypothetical protein
MSPLPKPVIRPATRADIEKLYPKGEFTATTRAMVGLVRGRPVGIGGIALVDGRLYAFAYFKKSARRYKVSIVKAAIGVIEEAKASGARFIYCETDPNEPGAVRWVTSLGFRPMHKPGVYRWTAK